MLRLSAAHWPLALISLVALRLVIGWHFYSEGVTKLQAGDFSAREFLANAKGPAAPLFRSLLKDHDGRMRLGLVQTVDADGQIQWRLDPLITEQTWKGFVYKASGHFGFEDPQIVQTIEARRKNLQEQLKSSDRSRELQPLLERETADLKTVIDQKKRALEIVENYIGQLRQLLLENETEILAYFRGAERETGFTRDGDDRDKVVAGVESLWEQSQSIRADRRRSASPWLAEVDAMWDALEADINALAVPDQSSRGYFAIERPNAPRYSMLAVIDRWLPWFDAFVGGLLIIGLFTRIASLAGAGLLAGVIATQPPFVLGSAPTIYQSVELVALLVLFATCAGRVAGLDALLHRPRVAADNAQPNEAPS